MEQLETVPDDALPDYSRKWHVMAAVAMGIFLATIDGSIVNIALPTLVRELRTDFPTVQWVVLVYLLTLSTLLPGMGRLGDMIGKKPVYTAGFVVFTVGSVLCGLSPNIQWLIAARVLQAIGGAMVFALGIALVTESFPPHERGRALGLGGTVVSVGIVVGPTLGGFLIDAFSWHWIFLVNLPVGVVGTWMVLRFVPNFRPVGRQEFDFLGAGALLVTLTSLLLALTWGQRLGFSDGRIVALFVTWAVFLVLFVWRERSVSQPMIELGLFRSSLFSVGLVTGFLSFVAVAGSLLLIPFYLENVLGYTTEQTGLMLAVIPLGLGVVAPLSGALSDRVGTRPISVVGLAILVAGYGALSTLSANTTTLGYVLRMLPIGVGMGMFQSPNNSAIMGAVPRRRLGIASGLLSVTRTLGQTTGIAVLGAWWASRVMAHTGTIPEGGATAAPVEAQVAGLRVTFLSVMGLVGLGLALSVWGWMEARKERA